MCVCNGWSYDGWGCGAAVCVAAVAACKRHYDHMRLFLCVVASFYTTCRWCLGQTSTNQRDDRWSIPRGRAPLKYRHRRGYRHHHRRHPLLRLSGRATRGSSSAQRTDLVIAAYKLHHTYPKHDKRTKQEQPLMKESRELCVICVLQWKR